jgi:callose synthase
LQIIAAARDVQEKTEIYTPYNILPLDSAGASLPIMQFEEVFLIDLMLNL